MKRNLVYGTMLFLTACQGFGPGDKEDLFSSSCPPNHLAIEECKRTDATTIEFKFRVGQALQGCDPDQLTTLGFDLHANGGGTYIISDDLGQIRNGPNTRNPVANIGDRTFTGTFTGAPGIEPELDGITVDEITGQEKVFDDATIGGCDSEPPLPPCTINTATHDPCNRTDAYTTQTKINLFSTLQNCDLTSTSDIGVTVTAPGGITSYKLFGPNGLYLEDENSDGTIPLVPGTQLSGGVHTNIAGAIATVQVRSRDNQGNKILLHTYTMDDCPWIPPCEDQLADNCNYINPNNHCQAATTYRFNLCETKQLTMKFSTNGFGLAQQPNGNYYPITRTIHHPDGTTTTTNTNPLQPFTFTFGPGDYLTASFGSNQPLPVPGSIGSTQLDISGDTEIPPTIITMMNDPC